MARRPRPRRRTFTEWLAESKKAVAALSGAAATAVSAELIPEPYAHYVTGTLAVATAVLTYVIENEDLVLAPHPAPHEARHADHPDD